MNKYITSFAIMLTLASCGDSKPNNNSSKNADTTKETTTQSDMTTNQDKHARLDSHSFAEPNLAKVSHLNLDIDVDFDQQIISGTAHYDMDLDKDAQEIIFDILEMDIVKTTVDGQPVEFEITKGDDYGDALHIPVEENNKKVSITYKTSSHAEALQWLNAKQTSSKKYPFLFTQGEAILTRTWIPSQDSPGIRITYDATVRVPKELLAVMSATNPTKKNESGEYTFKMDKAIPPYLIALAVGDIHFSALSDRTGVYAEKEMLKKSAYELADMEKMVKAAEGLYGDYAWGRYDVIVLPPSFPFGGMENPRLTFATPTIIVGDRSLTSLIAHELAHSWSGNLVTNSTWDDFWLNEGFTVYFEYRIMEAVYGKEYANMLKLLGFQGLQATLEDPDLPKADTHLKLNLKGRNPDDGMTDIAYEKGHMFLEMLEKTYGREKFDVFLKNYFNDHAFQNMTTERFVDILKKELIDKNDVGHEINIDEWIYGPGLPANCPSFKADQFTKISTFFKDWNTGKATLSSVDTKKWSTHEWLHFLSEIPNDLSVDKMKALDDAFHFTQSKNAEIQDVWYEKAIYTNYEAAYDSMSTFLQSVGRRKFLTPLYKAMKLTGKKDMALKIYKLSRDQYHSVATNTMDKLLDYQP